MTTYEPTLAATLAFDSECSIRDAAAILNSPYMKEVRDLLLQFILRHAPTTIETPTDLRQYMGDAFELPDATVRWLLCERQRSYVPEPHPLGDVWSDD